ncbi:MAG: hypothetical protein GX894_04010 [Clostridia bacterium]|nr:hypothetical protein [Clostridia bacterium]
MQHERAGCDVPVKPAGKEIDLFFSLSFDKMYLDIYARCMRDPLHAQVATRGHEEGVQRCKKT